MKTTLREIKKHAPCKLSWEKGLKILGIADYETASDKTKDREIDFKEILDCMGVKDAFWCLRTQEYRDYCLILVDIAESVLWIYEKQYPDDMRLRHCVQSIRGYKKGEIEKKKLRIAAHGAYAAAATTTHAAADVAHAALCAAIHSADGTVRVAEATKVAEVASINVYAAADVAHAAFFAAIHSADAGDAAVFAAEAAGFKAAGFADRAASIITVYDYIATAATAEAADQAARVSRAKAAADAGRRKQWQKNEKILRKYL